MSVQELSPNQIAPHAEAGVVSDEELEVPEEPLDAIERLPEGITLHRFSHEYWERVVMLHGGALKDRQRYFRWFGPKTPSDSMSFAERYAMSGESTLGIVAVDATNDPIGYASVSLGKPLSNGDTFGEFAVVVPDKNAHKGICTALAVCAGELLHALDVDLMTAEVRVENGNMKATLDHLPQSDRLPGARVDRDAESGVISFAVDLRGMPDCELDKDGMPHMIPGLSFDI